MFLVKSQLLFAGFPVNVTVKSVPSVIPEIVIVPSATDEGSSPPTVPTPPVSTLYVVVAPPV